MSYILRVAENNLQKYLRAFSVVGLTGPRQSGKSTLLQHMLPDYDYVTFDDPSQLQFLQQDPNGFMHRYTNKVIFDEAQNAPEIFNYVKMAVDQDRQNYGKFVLTGSSQFSFIEKITESLAGRIGLMTLLPLQYNEIPEGLRNQAVVKGCYPELVNRDYRDFELWYSAYFDTYLNRDVRKLAQVGDLRDFQRFVQLLAVRSSQELNMSDIAKDIGISVPTIKRWLSVLEASYVIFLLQPFYENFGKRITKRPKVYFYDTGLLAYLTAVTSMEQYHKGVMSGALFETYVVSEIVKKHLHQDTNARFYYLRVNNQQEVDLIIDHKTHREMIEIKHSMTFKPSMIKHLKSFVGEADQATLIYRGETFKYADNINIVNIEEYIK